MYLRAMWTLHIPHLGYHCFVVPTHYRQDECLHAFICLGALPSGWHHLFVNSAEHYCMKNFTVCSLASAGVNGYSKNSFHDYVVILDLMLRYLNAFRTTYLCFNRCALSCNVVTEEWTRPYSSKYTCWRLDPRPRAAREHSSW